MTPTSPSPAYPIAYQESKRHSRLAVCHGFILHPSVDGWYPHAWNQFQHKGQVYCSDASEGDVEVVEIEEYYADRIEKYYVSRYGWIDVQAMVERTGYHGPWKRPPKKYNIVGSPLLEDHDES